MEKVSLGKTALEVSRLGFGGGEIGGVDRSENEIATLLNGVLDAGINVLDTGRCYGPSEDLIGKHVSQRRNDFVLITKCCPHWESEFGSEWSAEIVRHSVETSLKKLKTDHVDVLLLHGCPEVALQNEVILGALTRCKEDGLTRFIGYSGDNEAALAAIQSGVIDCLETSVNICDQQVGDTVLPEAEKAGVGVFAKRPIAGSCWRDLSGYGGDFDYQEYNRVYAERLATMKFTPETVGFEGDWPEMALRFTLTHMAVHTALIGGTKLEHVLQNVKSAGEGSLPDDVYQAIRDAWRRCDDGSWQGRG